MPRPREIMNSEILHHMLAIDRPFVVAQDIVDKFDCSRSAANERLQELWQVGEIHRKKVGSRAVVYWHPDETWPQD